MSTRPPARANRSRQRGRVTAIVLAGGSSTRMGRPKPLVPVAGKPMLERVLETVRGANVGSTVVVLGSDADQVRKGIRFSAPDHERTVVNREFRSGLSSSLRSGLRASPSDGGAVLVVLGDQPYVSSETLRALTDAWAEGDGNVYIPTFRGIRGNPVLFDASLTRDAQRITGDVGCRGMFPNHESEIREVDVPDPGVLLDVDTLAELTALESAVASEGPTARALLPLVADRISLSASTATRAPRLGRRPPDVWTLAYELRRRGEPFALATVVGRRRPTSGQLGYKAVIRPDGTYVGWVGGACSEHILVSEALAAMRAGEPRKIRISPEEDDEAYGEGTVQRKMECKSGGTVEIYIEPELPRPTLVAVGDSPISLNVATLGPLLGFRTILVAPSTPKDRLPEVDEVVKGLEGLSERLTGPTYGVVATMGKFDESALQELLRANAAYVGLVASRTRSAAVLAALRRRKVPDSQVEQVRTPAGLDISARTPEEVALSILAEITQTRRSRVPNEPTGAAEPVPAPAHTFEDPVCHMQVEATTPLRAVHSGTTYYFCSEGCRERFESAPRSFLPRPTRTKRG